MTTRTKSFALLLPAVLLFVILADTPGLAQLRFRYDVKMGIDVLVEQDFEPLHNKRVALVSNQSGRTRTLEPTAEVLSKTDSLELVSILTPEHGYYGSARAGEEVLTEFDETLYGAKVHSLYGATRRPTREMLANCDVVLFDLQDVGLRSYTFLGTLYHVMDACAEYGKPLYVLDRPNPLGGEIADGNVLDSGLTSFVGIVPVPYVHGCTFGELATMINQEGWLPVPPGDSLARKCELTVIPMENWERWMLWEDTDFIWTPTSPYVPTVNTIRGMAITGMYGELSLANIGIGYTLPFRMFGMPGLKMSFLMALLQRKSFPGIKLVETEFRPFYGKYAGQNCKGLMFSFYPDKEFRPYTAGLEIVLSFRKTHPEVFQDSLVSENGRQMFAKVTGSHNLMSMLYSAAPDAEIRALAARGVKEFIAVRERYSLYP